MILTDLTEQDLEMIKQYKVLYKKAEKEWKTLFRQLKKSPNDNELLERTEQASRVVAFLRSN